MSRSEELRSELVKVLQGLGSEPTILYAVGVPMVEKGFNEDEIVNALMS